MNKGDLYFCTVLAVRRCILFYYKNLTGSAQKKRK